ncbi:MAG: hypothetical protein Aurels2KO_32780 [Aureliella sp.]
MQYQVVIQFPERFFSSHDEVLSFEERLMAALPRTCCVDGFDVGSGTVNFFLFTDFPLAAFNSFRKSLATRKVENNLRVSYRNVDEDAFTNLWPFRDPRPFDYFYSDGIDPFCIKSKRCIPKRSPPGVSKFETPAAEDWTDL